MSKENTKKCEASTANGASRMKAGPMLRDQAKRLRAKAQMLEALANETEVGLSDDAELALWVIASQVD